MVGKGETRQVQELGRDELVRQPAGSSPLKLLGKLPGETARRPVDAPTEAEMRDVPESTEPEPVPAPAPGAATDGSAARKSP